MESGIQPSDRTCLKLAKMYIKEGSLPSHPNQLEAVVKGLKKTSLFAGLSCSLALAVCLSPLPRPPPHQPPLSLSSPAPPCV